MTVSSLFQPDDAAGALPDRFTRAARFAMIGLILPPALLAVASLLGTPFRSGVPWLSVVLPAAGFAASGVAAGRAFERGTRVVWAFGAAFLLGGALIGPSYGSLQGLTGHEPLALVAAVPAGGFALGFAVAGLTGSLALPMSAALRARVTRQCALGGLAGGLVAAVPALLPLPDAAGSAGPYIRMLVAVLSFFGSMLAPYRLAGRAFRDAAARTGAPAG